MSGPEPDTLGKRLRNSDKDVGVGDRLVEGEDDDDDEVLGPMPAPAEDAGSGIAKKKRRSVPWYLSRSTSIHACGT